MYDQIKLPWQIKYQTETSSLHMTVSK